MWGGRASESDAIKIGVKEQTGEGNIITSHTQHSLSSSLLLFQSNKLHVVLPLVYHTLISHPHADDLSLPAYPYLLSHISCVDV